MKVSFVILAHEAPESLRILIETLLASGSDVFIHHDANLPHNLQESVKEWQLERFTGKLYHAQRVKVTWGEWSIVQATLNCLNLARKLNYNADYFMLLSGSCMPIKPVRMLESFLTNNPGIDFIEVVNAWEKQWITRGIQKERWEMYHFINWRSHPDLFSLSIKLQKKYNIKRQLPLKHTPYMGSQWWCLQKSTVESILALLVKNPHITRFYRQTWVPDELFFQTMVGNLISRNKLSAELLTRYRFNAWGIPRVYYDDDLPELLTEDTFFARKISHRAHDLRKKLSHICSLNQTSYIRLMSDENNEYARQLRADESFKNELKENAWFALATSCENHFDYIKSIPNPMVLVISSEKQVRKQALNALKKIPESVVLGDIFDPKAIDFGEDNESYAGYKPTDVKLANYHWHLFLGEIAFHAKGKTLVFSLGNNALPYLNVLRWKANLTVILLDGEYVNNIQNLTMDSIYLNSQVSHYLSNNKLCKLERLPLNEFIEFNNHVSLPTTCSLDHYFLLLDKYHQKLLTWPSFHATNNDRYELIKSIRNPVIIVYCYEAETVQQVLNQIQDAISAIIIKNPFNTIPRNRKMNEWWLYFCDLAYTNHGKTLVFPITQEHFCYLEIFRWKEDLALFFIEQEEKFFCEQKRSLIDIQTNKATNTEKFSAKVNLFEYLKEKHCQTYMLDTDAPDVVNQKIKEFMTLVEKKKKISR
jgi:hypothetical protein